MTRCGLCVHASWWPSTRPGWRGPPFPGVRACHASGRTPGPCSRPERSSPGPVDANVVRAAEVQRAIAEVAGGLEGGRGPVSLILPGGVARTALLELAAGVTAREFARYRITPGLPYPPDEALVDVLPVDGGRVLAAAVRRSVVEGYEAVAAAAGLDVERLVAPRPPSPRSRASRAAPPCPWTSSLAIRHCPSPPGREACSTSSAPASAKPARESRSGWDARWTGRRPWPATASAPRIRAVGPGAAELLRLWSERAARASPAGVRRERCPSQPRSWPGWARRWPDPDARLLQPPPPPPAAARRSRADRDRRCSR